MTVLDDLKRTYDWTEELLGSIGEEDLSRPTTCTEWDLRQLVNHLVGATATFIVVVRGETPEPGTDADILGDDPAGTFTRVARENLAAWRELGALDQTVQMSIGPMPADMAARFNLVETFTHTWDIARSLGRPTAVLDDVATSALVFAQETIKPEYRGGPIGAEAVAPPGSSAADRLAAFLGRQV